MVRSTWSASCDARGVQLWRTKGISSSTTWNSQNADGFGIDHLKTESFAYGYEGCAAKDAEFSVRSAVQEAADKRWSTLTFGLQASSESDRYGWKRFSDDAYLRVKYNRPPSQVRMSQLTMEYGGIHKKPGDATRVRTLGKIYANNVADPDGDSVAVQFQAKWDAGDGEGLIARWKPGLTSSKRSGSDFAISLPSSIPANKTVHWYARSYDGAQFSPWSYAGGATGCYFVYDTSVPKAPAVASGEHPASDPENPEDPWLDEVGQYGTFELNSSSTDVTRYRWGFNGDPVSANQVSTSAGAGRSVKVLPAKPGLNFITAQAFDEAGNGSEIRTYQFKVKAGQPERATWQLDEGAGATEAEGSTPPRTLGLHGGAATGAEGVAGRGLSLTGADGYASTDLSVADTMRGFSVSAWVKLSEVPDHAAMVASQVGNHTAGFELYYSASYGRWVFNTFAADEPGATIVRAMAGTPGGVKAGEWTHLVGTYDGVDKKLQLFVNGKLQITGRVASSEEVQVVDADQRAGEAVAEAGDARRHGASGPGTPTHSLRWVSVRGRWSVPRPAVMVRMDVGPVMSTACHTPAGLMAASPGPSRMRSGTPSRSRVTVTDPLRQTTSSSPAGWLSQWSPGPSPSKIITIRPSAPSAATAAL